jgi:hypothetical protein
MEVSGQLHAPAALHPGKGPLILMDRRLGGPQIRSGRGGEEKKTQSLSGLEPQNPDHPARSPALYRLSYRGSNNTSILAIKWLRVWSWPLRPKSQTQNDNKSVSVMVGVGSAPETSCLSNMSEPANITAKQWMKYFSQSCKEIIEISH